MRAGERDRWHLPRRIGQGRRVGRCDHQPLCAHAKAGTQFGFQLSGTMSGDNPVTGNFFVGSAQCRLPIFEEVAQANQAKSVAAVIEKTSCKH
jgi:hypothetical protein